MYKLDLEKIQNAYIHWIKGKGRIFRGVGVGTINCFTDSAKAYDCVDQSIMWKILKDMGIPDHLTYLLRNLCEGQEATVRTRHGLMDWVKVK